MSENSPDDLLHTLRERGTHYVVDTQGQPVAVLLTLEEYEHYIDLLEDEADSQDDELVTRIERAASGPTGGERQALREYLNQREAPDDEVQG